MVIANLSCRRCGGEFWEVTNSLYCWECVKELDLHPRSAEYVAALWVNTKPKETKGE